MKILLLSAYEAASHQRWREVLQRSFGDWQWTVLTLPARHFSWRLRSNSLTWAFSRREVLEADYDLVLATSMVDLSALRGFVPSLGRIPTVVYFHENQFAYPESRHQLRSLEPRMLNLYTALAGDRILFNSDFNRDTLLAGVEAMLAKFPDAVPAGLRTRIAARSSVLPVPLAADCFRASSARPTPAFEVLWNHRWEYDKGPEGLLSIVQRCAQAGLAIDWHIVGQQFRRQPAEFEQVRAVIEASASMGLASWGYVDGTEAYRQLLARSTVVLSTALHDFQGLSVLEAVAAGCVPLLPDRLCYPQWFDDSYRYGSPDPQSEADAAVQRLTQWLQPGKLPAAPDISALSIERLKPAYASVFREAVAGWPSAD